MTDYERYKQLLEDFNVEYTEHDYPLAGEIKEIRLEAGYKNVRGYSNFISEAWFDKEGKFTSFGIWEN